MQIILKLKYYIFFIVLLITFSCKKQEIQSQSKKIISLWETYNEQEHKVFLEIVKKFEQIHPDVKIKVQLLPWGGHEQKLLTSMITHTAPDIARVDLALLPRLVKSKTVVDLTPYGFLQIAKDLVKAAVESNIFPEDFYLNNKSLKPHIFGIPDQTTCVALFYNKDLFKKADITHPPKTWSEFIEAAKKLTVDTDNDNKIDQFGFGMDAGLWFTFPFLNTFGVQLLTDDLKQFNEKSLPKFIQALQLKVDLYLKHKVEAGAWIAGATGPDMGFLNKKYAMIFTGPWNLKRFKDANLNFGVSLIPQGPSGTSTNIGGTNMVILSETKYPEICVEFFKFLLSPEIQTFWSDKLGQIPVNLKAHKFVNPSPELKVFIEQIKTAIPRPKVLEYGYLEFIMTKYFYTAYSGDMSVPDAIKAAIDEINYKKILNPD